MSDQQKSHARAEGYRDDYIDGPITVYDLTQSALVVTHGWESEPYLALRAALRPDVLLVNVASGKGLDSLDEDDMRAAGWVRDPNYGTR